MTISSSKQGIVKSLILFLRPKFQDLSESEQMLAMLTIVPVLFTLPFGLAGLIWLTLITDLTMLWGNIVPAVLILIALFITSLYPFTIYIETNREQLVPVVGSLGSLLLIGAALLFGPTALWLQVLATAIYSVWRITVNKQRPFWLAFSVFSQEMMSGVFGWLIMLTIYRALGGAIPFTSEPLANWAAAIAGAILSLVLLSPIYMILIRQIESLTGMAQHGSISTMFINVLGLTAVVVPFAPLIPITYNLGGLPVFIVLLVGVLLVNQLAYQLSHAVEASQQRARELQHLEALGEAILQAPPDVSEIEPLLRTHVGGMFPRDQLEVRLFDTTLRKLHISPIHLKYPNDEHTVKETLWADLPDLSDNSLIVAPHHIEGEHPKHSVLLTKVMSIAENPVCIGGIALKRHRSTGHARDAMASVQSLASQISSALYRIEAHTESLERAKLSQELEVAGRIQASFLPRTIPSLTGWELAASLIPARQTSGDFYDFIQLPDGCIGIIVADVADKGTGAALYMALSRTLLRTYALQFPDDPSAVLNATNKRILADTASDQFVTLFYAICKPDSGEIIYANAGHNPAFVISQSVTSPIALKQTGIPLGMFDGMVWRSETLKLEVGQSLLMYTDGVSEAQASDGKEFGESQLITAACGSSAAQMHQSIYDAISAFVGNSPQFDDMTMVIASRKS